MQPTKKESPVEGTKRFFRSVMAELKKVNWPTRKELTTYTIVVIVTVIVVALIIFAWDSILTVLFRSIGLYRY
jgi:preprotein translocase subunit SecE